MVAVLPRDFERGSIPDVAGFISRCTGGHLDSEWASHVLADIIAGPEAVRDLWRDGQRVGVAVCIDTCQTAGNAAELSVFCSDDEVVAALLAWGEARAATAGRDQIDVPDWPGTALPQAVLEDRGYRVGHVMYDMKRSTDAAPAPAPRSPLPEGWRWTRCGPDTIRAYHETARRAFAGVPSAFVSTFEVFRDRTAALELPPALLVSTDDDTPVAAWVRIERKASGAGALASLGRHPRYRGLGLGAHLVSRGLHRLAELGIVDIGLEVAATNATGIALYESYGFRTTGEMTVYSRPVHR